MRQNRTDQIPLSSMKPGQSGIIFSVKEGEESLVRLYEMGLLEGQKLRVIKKAPLGDPLEVQTMNMFLCIRKKDAEQIIVELDS
jgi:ferrous iron transport protein A